MKRLRPRETSESQERPSKFQKKASNSLSVAGPSSKRSDMNSETPAVQSQLAKLRSRSSIASLVSKSKGPEKKSESSVNAAGEAGNGSGELALPPGPRTRSQAWLGVPAFKLPDLPLKISFASFRMAGSSTKRSNRISCLICTVEFPPSSSLKVPCGHHYCKGCIQNLIQNYTRDESYHPLRCCEKSIPVTAVKKFISSDLKMLFDAKRAEFRVLANDRVYCCQSTCSKFLGTSIGREGENGIKCTASGCRTTTCPRCKEASHPGERDCTLNKSTVQLRALAKSKRWQTCPGCRSLVERTQGCSNMVCRCGVYFCYGCGAKQGRCSCK